VTNGTFDTWAPPAFRPNGLVTDASFVRLVDVPFAAGAAALRHWWACNQHDGVVRVGSYLLVGGIGVEPDFVRARFTVRRRLDPLRHSLPMEVELSSWTQLPPVTRLELIARRRVRIGGRRRFLVGHCVVDSLVAALKAAATPVGC